MSWTTALCDPVLVPFMESIHVMTPPKEAQFGVGPHKVIQRNSYMVLVRFSVDYHKPKELYQSLSSSLLRLNKSLGNLESLTRTLATQPNAAVMPTSAEPDPIPEVTP